MYSKVGRLFIKAQKKQVVWVAGVMREEGITVDKVMDLVIEKEFSKGRIQKKEKIMEFSVQFRTPLALCEQGKIISSGYLSSILSG